MKTLKNVFLASALCLLALDTKAAVWITVHGACVSNNIGTITYTYNVPGITSGTQSHTYSAVPLYGDATVANGGGIWLGNGSSTVQTTWVITSGAPGWVQQTTYVGLDNGQVFEQSGGCVYVPPACYTNISWHVQNTYGSYRIFAVTTDGTAFDGSQTVAPNDYYSYTKNVTCDTASWWMLYVSSGYDDNMLPATNAPAQNPNPTNMYPNASANLTNMNSWTSTNLAVTFTNNPQLWSNITYDIAGLANTANANGGQAHSDSTALDKQLIANSQQATADANGIIAAIDKVRNQAHSDANNANNGLNTMGAQEHTDLQGVASAIKGLGTNTSNTTISNNINLTITNGIGTGMTNYATETTLKGIADRLTNGIGDTSGLSGVTNGANLTGTATAAMAGFKTKTDGMVSDVDTANDGVPSGTEIDADIDAGHGFHFRIRPSTSQFAPLFETMLRLSTFLLCMFYAGYVVKVLISYLTIWAKTPRNSFPNLPVLGTNALGLAMFIILNGVFMLLFAAGLGYFASSLSGDLDWHALFAAAGSSAHTMAVADSGGIWMVRQVFPLMFAFNMVLAAISWRIGMVYYSALVVSIIRLMP